LVSAFFCQHERLALNTDALHVSPRIVGGLGHRG
jgi:hypothetical protein